MRNVLIVLSLAEMENTDISQGTDALQAKQSKGPRKVSRRKQVKKPKRRGEYKPKILGIDDPDLAACTFSDDEVRFPAIF